MSLAGNDFLGSHELAKRVEGRDQHAPIRLAVVFEGVRCLDLLGEFLSPLLAIERVVKLRVGILGDPGLGVSGLGQLGVKAVCAKDVQGWVTKHLGDLGLGLSKKLALAAKDDPKNCMGDLGCWRL